MFVNKFPLYEKFHQRNVKKLFTDIFNTSNNGSVNRTSLSLRHSTQSLSTTPSTFDIFVEKNLLKNVTSSLARFTFFRPYFAYILYFTQEIYGFLTFFYFFVFFFDLKKSNSNDKYFLLSTTTSLKKTLGRAFFLWFFFFFHCLLLIRLLNPNLNGISKKQKKSLFLPFHSW